ncbi:dihydroorotase [Acidobacteriota bacterium]
MTILIKNGRLVDPVSNTEDKRDILIEKGKIAQVENTISTKADKTIDATDLVVAPGFIDMHVHLREPGHEKKETIRTGARAAAKGGFTSVACMPNTSPINDSPEITKFILDEAQKSAIVNVFPIAAVTKGLKGEQLTDMRELQKAGAIAFSDDGMPVANNEVMRRALESSNLLNTLIIDHCEDKDLSGSGVMHLGLYSNSYGLDGIPAASEEVMVSRNIVLAKYANSRVHIAHLSVEGAADLVRMAKGKGIRITAEVTPHHLLLTDESLLTHDSNMKMNPPLRSQEDVDAMIKALKDGVIDVLVTDHAPHSEDDKAVEISKAPFGIIGLETAVPLLLDRFVRTNIISLSHFVQMISSNPARILGLENKGRICIGADADLTLLNLSRDFIVDINSFESKSKNSPFHGWELKGCPEMTIVQGKIVYPFTN